MDGIFYPTGTAYNFGFPKFRCVKTELLIKIFSHLMELGFRVEAIGKKVSLENQDYLSTTGCSILSPTERVLP